MPTDDPRERAERFARDLIAAYTHHTLCQPVGRRPDADRLVLGGRTVTGVAEYMVALGWDRPPDPGPPARERRAKRGGGGEGEGLFG